MKNTYYHNTKCSKSRQGLELLQKNNIEIEVREYLKKPLSKTEVQQILKKMKCTASEIIRTKEALYSELKLDRPGVTHDDLINAIADHPQLLERPILETNSKAIIGRPPENLLQIL